MADKLIITQDRNEVYRIEWLIESWDYETGGLLGEGLSHSALNKYEKNINNLPNKFSNDEMENQVATVAASKSDYSEFDPVNGFGWNTKSAATKALREIKIALKAYKNKKPMPDWAIKATAEGWIPPKNWKP